MKICVIGLWHLGLVTSVCLAEKKHKVYATDFDKDLLLKLKRGQYKIVEDNLNTSLDKYQKNNSIKIEENINYCINNNHNSFPIENKCSFHVWTYRPSLWPTIADWCRLHMGLLRHLQLHGPLVGGTRSRTRSSSRGS